MRLIDADALIADVKKNNQTNFDKQDWTSRNVCTLLIGAPTIDAVPVVRGEWLEFVGSAYHGVDDDGEVKWRDVSIFHCDKCGRKTVVKENFCPSCGADMREEEQDNE